MMLGQGGPVKVFVATRPVDFRKGIDGLALAVQEMFGLDPFSGAVFVFRSKRAEQTTFRIRSLRSAGGVPMASLVRAPATGV